METIYAWHFSDGTLANGDRREIVQGMALACGPDKIELCTYGFHASRKLLDALNYAPGSVLSFVACEGAIKESDDKLVCSQRRHLIVVDIERTLHEFACWCAEEALKLVDHTDPRSFAAIEAKRQWLDGKITDNELDAARGAAWGAAWGAARDAAWGAAWDAAWGAAWDAARDAARDAAWGAARDAARGAAWDAAWGAARDAARDAQNAKLTEMVMALPEFATIKQRPAGITRHYGG